MLTLLKAAFKGLSEGWWDSNFFPLDRIKGKQVSVFVGFLYVYLFIYFAKS